MRAARFLLGLFLILALLAISAYLLRKPIAGVAVRSAMASAGLEHSTARISALSLSGVRLENVSAGPPGGEAFQLASIEADYDWRRLWSTREVEAVRIGPGMVRVVVSPDGKLSLPGIERRGGEGGGALPFSSLLVQDVALVIDTPEGGAQGTVSGSFDRDEGGSAMLVLETDQAGNQALRVEGGALSLDIGLAPDGAVSLDGNFTGDAFTKAGPLRDVDLSIEGDGRSWKESVTGGVAFTQGDARLKLSSARANVVEMRGLAGFNSEQSALIFGDRVSSLSLAADLALSVTDNGAEVSLAEAPITLRADNGAELVISADASDPLFLRTESHDQVAFVYALTGAAVSAAGSVNATTTGGVWEIVAPVRVGDYQSAFMSIDDASAVIHANMTATGIAADITTQTNLREAGIGRLNFFDTPFQGRFIADINKTTKQATIRIPPDHCASAERTRFTIDQQDTDVSLRGARLCEAAQPLAVIDWSGALNSNFAGYLTARNARYRLGKTRINGRPPTVNFTGIYLPAINRTTINGSVKGGSLTLRDTLIFTQSAGRFDFELNKQKMRATMHMDSVRITQNEEAPKIAPVMALGVAALQDKKVSFTYVMRTPAGHRLGDGMGIHDVATARGKSTFTFDRLKFEPGSLQPARLAPVMKGFIGETTGSASGVAEFAWAPAPQEIVSTADIIFEDVTFGGPSRVVNKTIGLNGRIQFADLWPITTDGLQQVSVEGVDLDALQLERGEISFDMPGDKTLRVEQALFPWFGGMLGVYKANASLAGGEAIAPLRADNIDLAEVLKYIDIEGLSGEGILSGVLPLVVEGGKARIENGVLKSEGPGAVRYQGRAGEAAAASGEQAQVAFDLLRDLRYNSLGITINGALDGRLDFQMKFEGTGEVALNQQNVRVPVIYRINLDAALLELLNQATLSRNIQLQIEKGMQTEE